ncbi:DUF4781 domain-containing protein [Burkholderia cenocepacia]|uniref:DUF4781 domain-containing protein n=1 Tax=Burkholderia cenocepacia TaxID=95486 RepID=UPI00215995E5|nr:DUF4781 domain-containing protein [Burkholderia cenocepacia]
MLSIDGMGLGLNWQRFLSQTLDPDLAPKPPRNTDGTSNDGPNNGPANPVNPTTVPPIPVQADLGTDPSKPTNAEIASATALLRNMADQYRVAPPEITVDNDTTQAVQRVIQDAQTRYDDAQHTLQGAQGVLRMTNRDPEATPDERKAARDNYTKAHDAAATAQRELDVTTDAGYRILYGEQAKADQYSADPSNDKIEGPAQQQADAKLAALQKLFPDQTKANPNFIPQQGDCKTPAQVQAYDDWQSATSTAVTAQAKYWADVSNANLAYTQFQSYMADPAYKDAIDTGVGKLNDALEPLQLQVDLPDPPPADANGNVDMNAVQANIAQAAKIANYSNAAYAASLDAQQVTTLQQKYDADSACLIGSTPGATKDDKAALDRATTQANTSGSYMQMLGAQLTVDDLQTKYDTAKSASDDWHIANPRSLDPHPTVDADLAAASDALAQAKQKASLAHDGFVVAYGQTLAQQYDDAGAQIDAQLKPKVPFVLQNPTPTLSTNPPPSTTPPSPSAQPSPSLSTSLPSPSSTASSAAPSTTQTPTPSSSLSTSAPPAALSTSLPPTTLFTNPSFVLQPPGSNTSVPTTATGQTALDAKKLHVVAGALRAADGRLSNTFNDAAAKFQLANAKTQEGVLKGKLADMQKTYDDWYANHPTPVRMREVNGDEIPMPTPRRPNPYQDRLDEARNNLQQADATINKLQLLTEMSRQQVLLDQFDASLAENLRNPQSQDDKDAYSKALDGFFRAHQGELSQSLLDQAGAGTNKAATIDFGKLTDNEQRNLIGTAIGLPPDVQPSGDTGTPTAPVNDDSVRYTDNEKLDTINKVRGEILELGGGSGTQVNILPLIYSDKTAGMVTSALFKVTDSKGHVQYVDDTSANYDNIGDYLDNNQLASSGTLDLVTGYDDNGHAQFQQKSAHHDDWFDSALNTLTGGKVNLGMMGLGLLMEGAGVLLDATGVGVFAGGALNFAGGLMMDTAIGSSMTKSALDIGSRWEHNQSINPFTDAGARGDWLNLVPMGAAGAAKFAGSEVFARTVTALRSARAARISTAIVRGTSLATGLGAAGESFVEAAVDFAHGDREHGWDALKSGFTNVALMGAGGVRDRVVNATVRVTGRPVVARSAGGERISIDGQQLQKILSRNEPSQLAFGATRASLDGVDIKVAKDGTLMAGDKVLTYDNMPVRVLDSLNNKDLNHLPRGTSVILGENGELSIVELTGKTWTEGTKIDSVTETGDRLSFGSDGEINAPSKLVAKTPVPSRNDPRQPASNDTPPADSAPRTTPANEAAARATAANDTATATTAASARNAQHTSEAQAARDENQQETRASDSHVAAQNRRSSDLRAAHDPAVARTPGAPGAGALEEPASVAPRTPVRVIDLTDAEPASRPATRDPAGVSVPRGPSVEALDHGEHTLLIVRNGEDPAAARPAGARPRAAGELPADVAEPIVVIADAADAHVAPELANRWQRPVFAAAPDALHADGTLRADAPLTRYLPAPDAAAAGGRVVGTNAQAAHADAAGVVEADAPAADPDAPAARRAPRPVNDDTVVVLASTRRNVADPDTHAAVPQPPARAARALDGAFSAPNRILVLVKPAERAPTQAANDAREAAAPKPARDARTQDHALPAAAHPDTTEAPADPSLAGPGLFTRLQMRFGGAPLPDAVHALAQQSGTLTQQLRMLSDAGWRVSLGKRGGGSRIDPKRRRVTIDGALHDSGSITYTLAHEAKHAVEAIDGTLDSLDYSGRSRFTRKALEAEARAQINAFEARYEIDLAGGGDIAANTTLPDAVQHEADRWSPSSDYAGTVERLADAFADAPVSGRHGETYQAFYDSIWDKQKRHGGAPRRMPAPHTTEGTGGAHLPRTLEEQVRWSFAHAETISPFAERGRHEPRQMTLRMLDERTSSGTEEPVTIIRGRTDATGQLLDAHGRPAQHVPFSIAHFLAGTSTSAGTGRALVLAADDGHAAAAWLTNTWQRPVYVPDGGTIRAFDAAMRNPGSQRPEARFDHAPTWTRYAPSPRERIDYGELAVDAHGLYVAGDPSRRLDPQALIGPFLGAGIEKSVFELGKRNAIGLYDVDPSRPRDGQLANHYDALDTERTGLDLLRRYGMRTLTIDGPFSVGNRIGILYHPLAELSSRAISLGALPSRITHESMQQLAAMREIVERDGLVFDFQGVVDARGEFYFSDPATIFRTNDREEIDATLEEIDTVIAPLERGIRTGSIALAHPAISESLPDGAFVQKPSRFTRIRMWFGGAPLPDAAYALAGRSSLLADQLRLLKSDGWQVVWGRAGRGSRTDVEQRRIVVDGGLRGTGTLVYTLAHEAGHAADVSNDRLGLDTSSPEAYVQSTLLAEARAGQRVRGAQADPRIDRRRHRRARGAARCDRARSRSRDAGRRRRPRAPRRRIRQCPRIRPRRRTLPCVLRQHMGPPAAAGQRSAAHARAAHGRIVRRQRRRSAAAHARRTGAVEPRARGPCIAVSAPLVRRRLADTVLLAPRSGVLCERRTADARPCANRRSRRPAGRTWQPRHAGRLFDRPSPCVHARPGRRPHRARGRRRGRTRRVAREPVATHDLRARQRHGPHARRTARRRHAAHAVRRPARMDALHAVAARTDRRGRARRRRTRAARRRRSVAARRSRCAARPVPRRGHREGGIRTRQAQRDRRVRRQRRQGPHDARPRKARARAVDAARHAHGHGRRAVHVPRARRGAVQPAGRTRQPRRDARHPAEARDARIDAPARRDARAGRAARPVVRFRGPVRCERRVPLQRPVRRDPASGPGNQPHARDDRRRHPAARTRHRQRPRRTRAPADQRIAAGRRVRAETVALHADPDVVRRRAATRRRVRAGRPVEPARRATAAAEPRPLGDRAGPRGRRQQGRCRTTPDRDRRRPAQRRHDRLRARPRGRSCGRRGDEPARPRHQQPRRVRRKRAARRGARAGQRVRGAQADPRIDRHRHRRARGTARRDRARSRPCDAGRRGRPRAPRRRVRQRADVAARQPRLSGAVPHAGRAGAARRRSRASRRHAADDAVDDDVADGPVVVPAGRPRACARGPRGRLARRARQARSEAHRRHATGRHPRPRAIRGPQRPRADREARRPAGGRRHASATRIRREPDDRCAWPARSGRIDRSGRRAVARLARRALSGHASAQAQRQRDAA